MTPSIRATVERLIAANVIASADYRQFTKSTNDDALSDVESQEIAPNRIPKLYLADTQTAGRGRQGNQWESDSSSLTFSLLICVDDEKCRQLLSLAIGVAITRAAEFIVAPRRLGLKWPNDVGCVAEQQGQPFQKIGGVLIESNASMRHLCVVGIGLNLLNAPHLDQRAAQHAACLADLSTSPIDRSVVLACLLESIQETLAELQEKSESITHHYRSRCVLTGKHLVMKQGDRMLQGYCRGIQDDGSMELVAEGKQLVIRSGEVRQIRSAV